MKTIEVGRPIEVDEKTGQLLLLVSEGRWEEIEPDLLRSIIPDTSVFVKFLEEHDLTDEEKQEANLVLRCLASATTDREPALAGGASETRRRRAKRSKASRGRGK